MAMKRMFGFLDCGAAVVVAGIKIQASRAGKRRFISVLIDLTPEYLPSLRIQRGKAVFFLESM